MFDVGVVIVAAALCPCPAHVHVHVHSCILCVDGGLARPSDLPSPTGHNLGRALAYPVPETRVSPRPDQ